MSDMKNEIKETVSPQSYPTFIFNRVEFALGDLGTLLPIAIAMIVLNGLNATNVMVTIGLFYIAAGLYYKVPVLVLPQIPMTIGNAILSNTDVMHEYFGERAHRASYRSIANSQRIVGIMSFALGGIHMCHGAGGMAAMYRFGARTVAAYLMIGGIFVALAILFGQNALPILNLLPMSVLGVLLVFAGAQLALMINDLTERKDLFVALIMLGITLTVNLAVAFISGIVIAYALKSEKVNV